jgi:hypothetical protein
VCFTFCGTPGGIGTSLLISQLMSIYLGMMDFSSSEVRVPRSRQNSHALDYGDDADLILACAATACQAALSLQVGGVPLLAILHLFPYDAIDQGGSFGSEEAHGWGNSGGSWRNGS